MGGKARRATRRGRVRIEKRHALRTPLTSCSRCLCGFPYVISGVFFRAFAETKSICFFFERRGALFSVVTACVVSNGRDTATHALALIAGLLFAVEWLHCCGAFWGKVEIESWTEMRDKCACNYHAAGYMRESFVMYKLICL